MGRLATQQDASRPKLPPHIPVLKCPADNPLTVKFVKDPMSFHWNINTKRPILAFDGSNFNVWENAIDRSLRQAFDRHPSFLNEPSNFDVLTSTENRALVNLLRNTVDDELFSIIEASRVEVARLIYETSHLPRPTWRG